MNKKVSVLIFAAIISLTMMACSGSVLGFSTVRGSGKVTEETRSLASFSGVALTTSGDLYIELGEEEEIRIEAEDNLIEYIETEIEGSELKIGTRDNTNIVSTEPVKFYLTVKNLDSIRVTGSGDVFAPDFEAKSFDIKVTGSGNLQIEDIESTSLKVQLTGSGDVSTGELKVEAFESNLTGSGKLDVDSLEGETVKVKITGSGDLSIYEGSVESQNIELSGAGKYDADNLESQQATVRITGSGAASIEVLETLDATLTGSGDLRYRGRPKIDMNASGSGDVKSIE